MCDTHITPDKICSGEFFRNARTHGTYRSIFSLAIIHRGKCRKTLVAASISPFDPTQIIYNEFFATAAFFPRATSGAIEIRRARARTKRFYDKGRRESPVAQ